MASTNFDQNPAGWTTVLCLLGAVIIAYCWTRPALAQILHKTPASASAPRNISRASRGVQLTQTNPDKAEADTDIDIIAIHGLDTRSPDTWTWRRQKSLWERLSRVTTPREDGVNWLQHKDMLPAAVDHARIFTCDWPADLLLPSSLAQKTIDEYAQLLLEGIQRQLWATKGTTAEDRPLFFIASCLGGIILIKSLVDADNSQHSHHGLRQATRGVIFLATPFRGTSFKDVAAWAQPGLTILASMQGREPNTLLDSLKGSTFDLEALVRRFTQLCQDDAHPCHVFNFYELGKTSLPSKVIPFLPASLRREKQLVDRSSATLDIVPEPLPLDRPHVLTNKFESGQCPDYLMISGKINQLIREIRKGSFLQQADTWILEKGYTADRLGIERLSGALLPMDQCYVNLVIIEQPRNSIERSENRLVSLRDRLKVGTTSETTQIELSTIFNPVRNKNNPRRILIRGRAGVGKTTLCKKIIHDFVQLQTWKNMFDRVLWVPLRNLKRRTATGYNLKHLFIHEYFSHRPADDGNDLAQALVRALDAGRTLFILDGLDEVSDLLDRDHDMSSFLALLLNQPNVIITSRPQARLPPTLVALDYELETVGFNLEQVTEYLRNTFRDPQMTTQIESFLHNRQLLRDLVRIPVQLDAFCYVWSKSVGSTTKLDTMTAIYQAIEQELWKKDLLRLDTNMACSYIQHVGQYTIETHANKEICLLEGIAFAGLHDNMVEFEPKFLDEAFSRFASGLLFDKTLPCLSFLRASDPSPETAKHSYHFLHLTYQEYFAARCFVRQWTSASPQRLILCKGGSLIAGPTPVEFLRKHKYTARYNILWRFAAGLLNARGEVKSFFDVIGQEPLDLLGRAHQRLVIQCLAEVPAETNGPQSSQSSTYSIGPLRAKLENHLVEWLLLSAPSSNFNVQWELELSPAVLCRALRLVSDQGRSTLLSALTVRPGLSKEEADLLLSWLGDDTPRSVVLEVLRILPQVSVLPDEVSSKAATWLEDSNQDFQIAALNALKRHGVLSEEVLLPFLATSEINSEYLQEAAIYTLARHHTLSDEAFSRITSLIDCQNETVRQAAVHAVMGRESPPDQVLTKVIERFRDEDFYVRGAAADGLAKHMGLSDAVLLQLVERLKDDNKYVRWAASKVLGERDQLPDTVSMQLIKQLDDGNSEVRLAATQVLSRLKRRPGVVFAQLVKRFDDSEWEVRETAVGAFRGCELSESTVTQLAKRLDDSHWEVRERAIRSLAGSNELSDKVLVQLAILLGNSQSDVRRAAVEALSEREVPDTILTQLASCVYDEDPGVRKAAAKAFLGREVPGAILTEVTEQLKYRNSRVRAATLQALAERGEFSNEFLTYVPKLLGKRDEDVVLWTLEALALQNDLPEEILTQVAARLDHDDWSISQKAIEILTSRTKLPAKIIASCLQSLCDLLLRQSRIKNIWWTVTNEGTYLQGEGPEPVQLTGWTESLTKEVLDILKKKGIPGR